MFAGELEQCGTDEQCRASRRFRMEHMEPLLLLLSVQLSIVDGRYCTSSLSFPLPGADLVERDKMYLRRHVKHGKLGSRHLLSRIWKVAGEAICVCFSEFPRNCSAKIQQFGWGRLYDVPNLAARCLTLNPASLLHSWCVRIGAATIAQHSTDMTHDVDLVEAVLWCYKWLSSRCSRVSISPVT